MTINDSFLEHTMQLQRETIFNMTYFYNLLKSMHLKIYSNNTYTF